MDDSAPLPRSPPSIDQDYLTTSISMTPTPESYSRDCTGCSCTGACNCSEEAVFSEPHSSTPLLGSSDRLIPRYGSSTMPMPSAPINIDSGTCEASVRCGCHVKPKHDSSNRKAKIKLIIACIIALVFMIGEVIGMYTHTNTHTHTLSLSLTHSLTAVM